jgi:hypothetical protein
MKCKQCGKQNERESDYCSRECYMKGKWRIEHPDYIKDWFSNKPGYASKINKKWYKSNKERHLITVNEFKENNPEYMDEWHEKHPGYKEEYRKKWNKDNPKYGPHYKKTHLKESNARSRFRYKTDINYKIIGIVRARIRDIFKRGHKSLHTMEYLGCSAEFLRQHIERLMVPEMSWLNYGMEWEIDHIIPKFMFDLDDIEEQKKYFNWSNQRPLWKTTEIANKYGYNKYIGNRNRSKIPRTFIKNKNVEIKNG